VQARETPIGATYPRHRSSIRNVRGKALQSIGTIVLRRFLPKCTAAGYHTPVVWLFSYFVKGAPMRVNGIPQEQPLRRPQHLRHIPITVHMRIRVKGATTRRGARNTSGPRQGSGHFQAINATPLAISRQQSSWGLQSFFHLRHLKHLTWPCLSLSFANVAGGPESRPFTYPIGYCQQT
jgi:hypothetical protein